MRVLRSRGLMVWRLLAAACISAAPQAPSHEALFAARWCVPASMCDTLETCRQKKSDGLIDQRTLARATRCKRNLWIAHRRASPMLAIHVLRGVHGEGRRHGCTEVHHLGHYRGRSISLDRLCVR